MKIIGLNDVVATVEEIYKAEQALLADPKGPFDEEVKRELAKSIGECEAFSKSITILTPLLSESSIQSETIQSFLLDVQLAKNAMLKGTKALE